VAHNVVAHNVVANSGEASLGPRPPLEHPPCEGQDMMCWPQTDTRGNLRLGAGVLLHMRSLTLPVLHRLQHLHTEACHL
jgi:hypothetical protein